MNQVLDAFTAPRPRPFIAECNWGQQGPCWFAQEFPTEAAARRAAEIHGQQWLLSGDPHHLNVIVKPAAGRVP